MEGLRATGRDFADALDEIGEEAVVASIRDARPQPQFPPGYTMRTDGLHLEDEGLIAGHFEVVAQTRDRHGNAWGVLLKWKDDDGHWHQLAIAKRDLAGDGIEARRMLMDGGLFIAPSKKRRDAFTTFLQTVKSECRARAVTKVGWERGSFALPDRTIAAAEERELVIYQGQAALDHEYKEAGTLAGWQDGVAKYAIGNSRVAFALASAFVGPLLAAVGEEGGGVHFRGPSSIGKSTALQAAASVWGSPAFVRQWRATANGLEGLAEQANETLLVLDELAQLDEREAGSVAYLLANGCGKSRAHQSGDAKSAKRWRTIFLSSGEVSLAEHARGAGPSRRSAAGQEVRIIDVEADAGQGLGLFDTLGTFTSGDTLARAIKAGAAEHYGMAGPAFVQQLVGKLDHLADNIRRGVDDFVSDHLPANSNGQVSRACRRIGLVAAAGEIAASLGVLPWRVGVSTEAAASIFSSWLEARGGAGPAEDRAILEHVRAYLIQHGQSRFQPLLGEAHYTIVNRVGFYREDGSGNREYLVPSSSWKEVCQGAPGGEKAVRELLRRRGHLAIDSSGKGQLPISLPGMGRTRCYTIRPSIFEDGQDA